MQHEEIKSTEEQQEKVENTQDNISVSGEQVSNETVEKESKSLSDEPVSETSELEQLQQELNEQKDKYLRLFAEFDNFKKRSAKEKRDFTLVAAQDIMKELLAVIDDYKRANKSFSQDGNKENFADGLQLIFDKFNKILASKGLKEMESIGTDFDFGKHEAIAEIPAPTEELKGKVIDEVEAGYLLNSVIIRYAKVVVGK
ncbi:MAG: nucleotide exchange factor GrpE [Chitinophagales bacterium]